MTIFAKKIGLITALTAPLMTSNTTQAEQPLGIWDIGARLSTVGIQGEVGYLFNKTFAMRLQAGGFDYHIKKIKYDKEEYKNLRFRPMVATLYADWYFLTNWWRASMGISYNHTKIRIHRDFRKHQMPYILMGIFSATYQYKHKFSPYLGTGVDIRNLFGSKFIFSADVGLNYFGNVKVRAAGTGPAGCIPIAMTIAHKEARKLLDEKWWMRYFPVLSIGLKYEL